MLKNTQEWIEYARYILYFGVISYLSGALLCLSLLVWFQLIEATKITVPELIIIVMFLFFCGFGAFLNINIARRLKQTSYLDWTQEMTLGMMKLISNFFPCGALILYARMKRSSMCQINENI